MKGLKDFIKDILAIALIAGICFGGYTLYKNCKVNEAKSDDSYKVLTNKDPSYDGFYTLSKLDDKGNPTKDGLTLRVEKDRIIMASESAYIGKMSIIKDRIIKETGDKTIKSLDMLHFVSNYAELIEKYILEEYDINIGELEKKGGSIEFGDNVTVQKWFYEIPDNIKLDEVLDVKTPFEYLKQYDLLPAFDEKSGEVWMSKLLKNEQSKYHEGYRLKHYADENDWFQNSVLK